MAVNYQPKTEISSAAWREGSSSFFFLTFSFLDRLQFSILVNSNTKVSKRAAGKRKLRRPARLDENNSSKFFLGFWMRNDPNLYKQSFPLKVSDEPLVKLYLVFGAAATEKHCFCKTRTFYRKGQSGCWRTNHVPPAEPRVAVAVILSNTQQTSERHTSSPTSYTTTQQQHDNTKQNFFCTHTVKAEHWMTTEICCCCS